MFLKTTKKLFQKTIDSVKSIFSSGYQKIPKSPPCTPLFPCSNGVNSNLDKFYKDFNTNWGHKNPKKKNNKEISPRKSNSNYQVLEKERDDQDQRCELKLVRFGSTKSNVASKKKNVMYEGKKKYKEISSNCRDDQLREERSCLVAQKLKELKMLEKSNNEEHALDIEEVLHYYSRLTCPAYVEIVDKFFMEIYTELFNQQQQALSYNNPNMGFRRVKLY